MMILQKHSITLNINGKTKKFKAPKFISSDVFQKTMQLEKDFDDNNEAYLIIEKCYPLICEIFGNQFTLFQLQKGLDVREVLPATCAAIDHVINHMELSRSETVPNKKKVVVSIEDFRKNN